MTKIGVIGKREALPDSFASVEPLVAAILDRETKQNPAQTVVFSTLATGICRHFVEMALARGCRMEAVVPYAGYAEEFEEGAERLVYRRLIGRAVAVRLMPFDQSSFRAFESADRLVVDAADTVLVFWDGDESSEVADTLYYAARQKKRVLVIHPDTGVERMVSAQE